jgi:rubredoxin
MGQEVTPIPMLLWCPECGARHVDGLSTDGTDWATKPHHTHACQNCGMVWRPALVPTCGVRFLPGFKNEAGTMAADHGRGV